MLEKTSTDSATIRSVSAEMASVDLGVAADELLALEEGPIRHHGRAVNAESDPGTSNDHAVDSTPDATISGLQDTSVPGSGRYVH